MKLLCNLVVTEDNPASARPSDCLESLPHDQQITAVTEFLNRAGNGVRNNQDPQARAEAGIGVVTATGFFTKTGLWRSSYLHR
jgi:hypothetical protein